MINLIARSPASTAAAGRTISIGMESTALALPLRGRPREFDAEQALTAALRIFWTHGYEGASLTALTEAMGISRPSLYAAFGNKEALFRAAFDLYERDKLAYMQSALDAPTLRGVAERLLRGAFALQCEGGPKGCLGVISSSACGVEANSIKEEVVRRRASSHQAMIARFERGAAEGDLPQGFTPEALSRYLMTVMQGLSVQASGGATSDELAGLVETALAVWPTR